ncbi:hypothetical protein RhiirC2_762579 [Rhizophagus irregularis]|uniref:Uncharacterized protein n=1 Tax=Rhizophagus irregularis TaxID=588596 RepID=A0A2N1MD35_9GLOM|nr:hypothetical protein RhiirC2_762579 [Rhizophagus irregularis]
MGGGIHDNVSSKLRTGNEYLQYQTRHLRGNFTITWICSSRGESGKYFEIFLIANSSSLS